MIKCNNLQETRYQDIYQQNDEKPFVS